MKIYSRRAREAADRSDEQIEIMNQKIEAAMAASDVILLHIFEESATRQLNNFNEWINSPYTKALYKSIETDYVPKSQVLMLDPTAPKWTSPTSELEAISNQNCYPNLPLDIADPSGTERRQAEQRAVKEKREYELLRFARAGRKLTESAYFSQVI